MVMRALIVTMKAGEDRYSGLVEADIPGAAVL